jgi:hypothetical protein
MAEVKEVNRARSAGCGFNSLLLFVSVVFNEQKFETQRLAAMRR